MTDMLTPVMSANWDEDKPWKLARYEATGGYRGLRKALGAKRRDIMSQILTEAVTLSTCGGLAGIDEIHGSDCQAVISDGIASVTPMQLNLTEMRLLGEGRPTWELPGFQSS